MGLSKEEAIEQRCKLVDFWKDEIIFMKVQEEYSSLQASILENELRRLNALSGLSQYKKANNDKEDTD